MDILELAEHSAAESRSRVPAPPGKFCLSPEVIPIDVAVSEVHRALMRLIVVFARYVACHGKAARDDSSLGASQGKEIWLGGGRTKVVGREGMPADQNVDAISSALDFHRLCSTRRS